MSKSLTFTVFTTIYWAKFARPAESILLISTLLMGALQETKLESACNTTISKRSYFMFVRNIFFVDIIAFIFVSYSCVVVAYSSSSFGKVPHYQMLAVMVLSQHRVSTSKTVSPRIPVGARCTGHVRMMCSAVCSAEPHSQFDVGARPHLCMND